MQHNNTPQGGQISIQEIISIYIGLASIPNRSENINNVLINLEALILSFSKSFTHGAN